MVFIYNIFYCIDTYRYIPYQKVGKAVRFSLPEIQEWLNSRRVTPLEKLPVTGDTGTIDGGEK